MDTAHSSTQSKAKIFLQAATKDSGFQANDTDTALKVILTVTGTREISKTTRNPVQVESATLLAASTKDLGAKTNLMA